jgi:tetratricopeptide (TPR) repeat protein
VLALLVLLSFTAVAAPPEDRLASAEIAFAEINQLLKKEHPSEALRLAREAAAKFSTSADVRFMHGTLLSAINDHVAAAAELRKVIELAPENAAAHAQLSLSLGLLGDDAGAETALGRALALEPDNAVARSAMAELQARKRLRAGVPPATLPEGTPQRAVADFAVLIAENQAKTAFERHVDRALLDGVAKEIGANPDPVEFLDGVRSALQEDQGAKLMGWEVAGETLSSADALAATVDVNLLLRLLPSEKRAQRQRSTLESDAAGRILAPDALKFMRALEPDDRRTMIERFSRMETTQVLKLVVELTRSQDGWKIRDGVVGDPKVAVMRISEVAKVAKLGDPQLASPPLDSRARRVGRVCGTGGAVALIVAIFFAIARRRRRPRGI